MSQFTMSGLIVGLLAMLFWTPFLLSRGISKLDNREGALNFILCMIPVLNVARAEHIYRGRVGLMTISPIAFVIGVIIRYNIWMNSYSNPTIGTISIIIFWGVLFLYMISNMIFVYTVIHDTGAVEGFKLWLLVIAFPFGQYYIGTYLHNVIRTMQEREATFKK